MPVLVLTRARSYHLVSSRCRSLHTNLVIELTVEGRIAAEACTEQQAMVAAVYTPEDGVVVLVSRIALVVEAVYCDIAAAEPLLLVL
jgi:hypothetical protein